MKRTEQKENDGRKRLSFPVILAGGFVCALLSLASIVAIRHIQAAFAPTLGNSERLLAKGKPAAAKDVLDRMKSSKRGGGGDSGRELLHRGKVLYSVLLGQLREEKWGSYGVNPDNWISHPLAEEAEKCFRQAMEIAPDDPEIRLVLGNLYREQGRFADSERMLRSALELDESNAEVFLTLGLLYAEGERLPAAEKALRFAWELDTGNAQTAKNIAYFYRYYKDIPESTIVWFGRYFSAGPRKDPDVNVIKAELKNLVERYPEFEKHYKEPPEPMRNRGEGRKSVQKRRRL